MSTNNNPNRQQFDPEKIAVLNQKISAEALATLGQIQSGIGIEGLQQKGLNNK